MTCLSTRWKLQKRCCVTVGGAVALAERPGGAEQVGDSATACAEDGRTEEGEEACEGGNGEDGGKCVECRLASVGRIIEDRPRSGAWGACATPHATAEATPRNLHQSRSVEFRPFRIPRSRPRAPSTGRCIGLFALSYSRIKRPSIRSPRKTGSEPIDSGPVDRTMALLLYGGELGSTGSWTG